VIASERVRSFDEISTPHTAGPRLVREVVSVVSRVSLMLLLTLTATGCTSFPFFKKSPPPVTQRELPKTQPAPAGGSPSETLRNDAARRPPTPQAPEPPRAVQPTPAQEPTQPQPAAAPAAVAPVQNGAEPDPRAVIDWLLKERR
jgi:hypothetical protein